MDSIHHTLHAMVRHMELLGWHIKQMRNGDGGAEVATEIDGGIDAIKDALSDLGDELSELDKMRERVREIADLGLIQDAINGEREYEEAMSAEADARR